MSTVPLLVFDFDGVLVDGMPEYWFSARRAALQLKAELQLSEEVPADFCRLRPLIHKGWEMVLMAAELSRHQFDLAGLLSAYEERLPEALARWDWTPALLQKALEQVRQQSINHDLDAWLGLHRFYPGVEQRLRRIEDDGGRWAVLTTKGEDFARRILTAAGLEPWALFGHEQGSKPDVLAALIQQQSCPIWFLEDRCPTLEQVCSRLDLAPVRCFLVSWGYLGPGDDQDLPAAIHWLEPARFQAPLAEWP